MSGQGDDKAERVVERLLARGPCDVLDIVAAVREALPTALALREGAVHAVLHRLVRTERVLAGGRSARGLTLYRAPGSSVPGESSQATDAAAPSDAFSRMAIKAASGVRDPANRGRILADVGAHLGGLAEDDQAHRFGSARPLRHLLHRVDRGRPTVCVPATGADTLRRFLLHEGPWIFGAVLLFFVLKIYVSPIYSIPSKSMLPTLQVGDRVAVFFPGLSGVPERWAIVTYEKGKLTFVKRLVGLPGEEIAILHGDVYIDGALLVKPDEVRRALRSHVGNWDFRDGTPRGWKKPEPAPGQRTWEWGAGGFPAHRPGSLGNSYVMRDGYARLDGERGARGDLVLALLRGPGGSADGKAVMWTLEVGMRGIVLREERFLDGAPEGPSIVLASRGAATEAGATRLELSYVDGVLSASCGGWHWSSARAAPDAGLSVHVTERGAGSHVRSVNVDRDVHYAHLGTQGVPHSGSQQRNPHRISKSGVFCMGDNTTDSRDSRYRDPGDIPVDKLIGAVRIRIWPPSRWGRVR